MLEESATDDVLKKAVVRIRNTTNLHSHIRGVERGLKERGCRIRYEEMKGDAFYIHFSYNENKNQGNF
jgi:hypothetical protein